MGKYTFVYQADEGGTDVGVSFDDTENQHISAVLNAFTQFLLGVTFHEKTIDAYIDTDKVDDALRQRAWEKAQYDAGRPE